MKSLDRAGKYYYLRCTNSDCKMYKKGHYYHESDKRTCPICKEKVEEVPWICPICNYEDAKDQKICPKCKTNMQTNNRARCILKTQHEHRCRQLGLW